MEKILPAEKVTTLTREDLALRWKCSKETLKRRQRSGILPALKLGRLIRYKMEDVQAVERSEENCPPRGEITT